MARAVAPPTHTNLEMRVLTLLEYDENAEGRIFLAGARCVWEWTGEQGGGEAQTITPISTTWATLK